MPTGVFEPGKTDSKWKINLVIPTDITGMSDLITQNFYAKRPAITTKIELKPKEYV